jgi:uncharacterized membrane protein YkgB
MGRCKLSLRNLKTNASHGHPSAIASALQRIGCAAALFGKIVPLPLIGGLKFTQFKVDALKPLISGTPWLARMYPVLGETGASWLLGGVEIGAALLLIASIWWPKAAVAYWLLAVGISYRAHVASRLQRDLSGLLWSAHDARMRV